MKLSRRGQVEPFYAMEILREANALEAMGKKIWHLETGEPLAGAPKKVLSAAKDYINTKHIGYTDALGIPELRERVSQHYFDYYGLHVQSKNIAITTGSSAGLLLSLLAAFDVGDKIAVAEPGYPAYLNMLHSLNIEPVSFRTTFKTRFQPTIEILDSLPSDVDGLIIASPANPTGSILSNEELSKISCWCENNNVRIISDEVYHGVTYGSKSKSVLGDNKKAIVANGFSKYYAMTGWRLGWIIMPDDLVQAVERLAQNLFISPPAISQNAAIHAFDCSDELDLNLKCYSKNQKILKSALERSGFGQVSPPDGAFYLYVDISPLSNNSEKFCKQMLSQAGIAATPGIDFDPKQGKSYVRFSYAGSTEDILGASSAIEKWVSKYENIL